MLFLVALVGAAVVAFILWKTLSAVRDDAGRPSRGPTRPRVSGPDDDPDFLRQLDEKVRRPEDPPA